MKLIDNHDFELPETFSARRKVTLVASVGTFLRALKRPFQPSLDVNRLNTRLLRDAGIDQQELERARLARAPLIR